MALADPCKAGLPDAIFTDGAESTVFLVARMDYPSPLAGATIEAQVAGRVFTTTADGTGAFELRITPRDDNRVTVLLARGTGAQAHIQFASILDTMPVLMAQAGPEGRLEVSENPYVRPTPFTSGVVVALQGAQPAAFTGNMPLTRPDFRVLSAPDLTIRMQLLTGLALGVVALPVTDRLFRATR